MISSDLARIIVGCAALLIGMLGLISGKLMVGAEAGEKGWRLEGMIARFVSGVLVVGGIALMLH